MSEVGERNTFGLTKAERYHILTECRTIAMVGLSTNYYNASSFAAIYLDANGYDQGAGFRRALEGAIDEVAERDIVFATAFHEWCAVEADEEGTGWIRGLIEQARKRDVEVTSYADYWARTTAASDGAPSDGDG